MTTDTFQIDFERSGGFTGTTARAVIPSSELDKKDLEELHILIRQSGFFEAMVTEGGFLSMPDQFRYRITIEYGGRTRSLDLTEGSVPDSFRPLINRLVRMARKHRRR